MALKKLLLALPAALLLAGCATSSFSGYSSDPAAQIVLAQNPYIKNGKISGDEAQVVINLAGSCHGQIAPQMAGAAQSTLNGAVPYGVAGFLGVGGGATTAFAGAKFVPYGAYGGIADAAEGGVNGAVTGSYQLGTATGSCVRTFVNQLNTNQPNDKTLNRFQGMFDGLDVEPVTAGKSWGGDRPPALDPNATWPMKSTLVTGQSSANQSPTK